MDTHMLSRMATDVHVQLMRTVDLWDNLLLRMEGEGTWKDAGVAG